MILFPNAKINLGLNITARRPDGYHDVETVMIPVAWHDVLEIVPAKGPETTLTVYGRRVDCPPEKNLVMKAYRALADTVGGLPPADICLEKVIPDGAGLGGGSADAAFTLLGLDSVFNLGLPVADLEAVAARIGADCPFFIRNRPAFCHGTGTDIEPFDGIFPFCASVLIAKPRVAAVSTRDAYAAVVPRRPDCDIRQILAMPPAGWRGRLANDFEVSVFPLLPEVAALKEAMYAGGAVYAAMSGSGASVFGFFEDDNLAQALRRSLPHCDTCISPYPAVNV